ncbi:prostacyclin synthase isoform X2 [Hyla sarda]|uniref:prostacyclin synthase isoform X2 n=1 Tax=Hyla sarda TaxID=327740 RepID=UPI0024C23678|nr:prostacyclin synthase isoform X2 [Hyla sarda]
MIASLFLAISLTVFIWAAFLRRRRQSGEPPLDCGLIPWLGHALEFGSDVVKFFTRMKAKHGDIFTVQVAGRFLTVLLDPYSYDGVLLQSSDKLDFGKYAKILMERMFDVQLPDHDTGAEMRILQTHLQHQNLQQLTSVMFYHLSSVLSSVPGTTWREEGLLHFSYGVMLRSGYLTLFGSESIPCSKDDLRHSLDVYNEFSKVDRLLMKSARVQLSAMEKKELRPVKEKLWQLLDIEKLCRKPGRSKWIESYQRHLQELGVPTTMQCRAMLLQLWATQGNTGPAAFWLLLFLLKNHEAMAAVQAELEDLLRGHEMRHAIRQETLDCAIVLNSALEECLRLTAAPFITREVQAELPLKLADGREYTLRKGDRLCLFPYISPQMDPEIHMEPQMFQYDRFLKMDTTQKTHKTGRRLTHVSMPWGAGSNICVGRFHAINSIKLFVWLMLLNFEFELKNPTEPLPEIDRSRYGFGVVQPEGDVVVRYRKKYEQISTE